MSWFNHSKAGQVALMAIAASVTVAIIAAARQQSCEVAGLSADIAKVAAKSELDSAWRSKLEHTLHDYFGVKDRSVSEAQCPARPYLELAGQLAMSGKVISAQAVIGDMPRSQEALSGPMREFVVGLTRAPEDDAAFVAINERAHRLVQRTQARDVLERKYVTMMVYGAAYGDEIAAAVGNARLHQADAAPSVIVSAIDGGRSMRRMVEDIRSGRVTP